MTLLATQTVVKAGLNPTYAAAAGGGDTLTPGPRTFLHVKNGHTSSQTVTINSIVPSDQGTDVDLVVAVPNAGERMIGPIEAPRFARASDGQAEVTYSGVTLLTVAVITV